MFIWGGGYGLSEPGNMLSTNKFFIEMETQLLASAPKERGKPEESDWDSQQSSEIFVVLRNILLVVKFEL